MELVSLVGAFVVIPNHMMPANIGRVQHGTPKTLGVGIPSFELARGRDVKGTYRRCSLRVYYLRELFMWEERAWNMVL